MSTEFVGRRRRVFWLALKAGVLTVLTLGLYRFWMKTRLRRWYWSAIRPGGLPLEYVGDPVEKLLGFLIAVVILAFYIGVVNLILMFISFSLFQGNVTGYLLSFIGVIPLWFYAQYRSRRYVLARTRWCGLRFGLEPGAWGYAGRALLYWLLTLISAGLLWPLMTFRLEQYKTDRTTFGTARMIQGGRWTMLYRPMRPLLLGALLMGGAAVARLAGSAGLTVLLAVLGNGLTVYGLVHYTVQSTALLTRTKQIAGITLDIQPSTGAILGIYALGYVLAGIVIAVPAAGLVAVMLSIQSAQTLSQIGMDGLAILTDLSRWAVLALSAALYFSIFLMWSALTHAFVTMPVIRHYARTLRLGGTEGLAAIRQRPRDEVVQAEGFAEALDVGASI
ncbi:MAG: DUF898 family protein [Roseivivax sp.]|nr:DUF898 family protein [Roseivivax sp.]